MAPSSRWRPLRTMFMAVLVLSLLQVAPIGAQELPAAIVLRVDGLAYNYHTDVSLFGGPSARRGYGQPASAPASAASPSVECPLLGGTAGVTDADGARGVYGPATIFGGIWPLANNVAPPSGPLTSSIDCRLGVNGYVTASTGVTRNPSGTTWTTPGGATESHPGGIGPGPLIADEAHSTCTMAADGTVTSNVSFVNGIVETSYDPNTQEPVTSEPIPNNPPPGYKVSGTIDHVGDSFRITFNKQTTNPDGSFTVVAAHMELLGPTAVGDLVLGSSTCGLLGTGTLGTG